MRFQIIFTFWCSFNIEAKATPIQGYDLRSQKQNKITVIQDHLCMEPYLCNVQKLHPNSGGRSCVWMRKTRNSFSISHDLIVYFAYNSPEDTCTNFHMDLQIAKLNLGSSWITRLTRITRFLSMLLKLLLTTRCMKMNWGLYRHSFCVINIILLYLYLLRLGISLRNIRNTSTLILILPSKQICD